MQPFLTVFIGIAGAVVVLWLAWIVYGLVRKDKVERQRGRRKFLGLDSYGDNGGDGGAD